MQRGDFFEHPLLQNIKKLKGDHLETLRNFRYKPHSAEKKIERGQNPDQEFIQIKVFNFVKQLLTSDEHDQDGEYLFGVGVGRYVPEADAGETAEGEVERGDVGGLHRGTPALLPRLGRHWQSPLAGSPRRVVEGLVDLLPQLVYPPYLVLKKKTFSKIFQK